MVDRRRNGRLDSCLLAEAKFASLERGLDCLVRNVSEDGAMLVFAAKPWTPDEFDLRFTHLREGRRARIVWQDRWRVGIAFVEDRVAPALRLARALRERAGDERPTKPAA